MRIGIDLGGTKIEGVVLTPQGEFRHRRRLATPGNDYQEILRAVAQLVAELEREAGDTCRVGIGTPGARSPKTGLMRNCNTTCLNGRPLFDDLRAALQRDIRLANDADCFALSEAVDGAAAGARTVFGVILGTGVGGGVVVDRTLLAGPNAIAGEWGHNPLPFAEERRPCYCGRFDCVETYLCGRGLLATHHRLGGGAADSLEVVAQAQAGETQASQTLDLYAQQLAQALSVVINILDPEVVVLGGGLSNIDSLYRSVPQYWHRHVFSDVVNTRLVRARYGDASGVRGAAWLWS